MGLNAEQTAGLTLADLEAIAARFAAAVATIREAQALLGGAASLPAPAPVVAVPVRAPQQTLSAEQQAELDNWRHSAARAKLLEQVRGNGTEEAES